MVRSHIKNVQAHHKIAARMALAAFAAVTVAARSAEARDLKVGFMADFVQGLSIPIADGNYKKFADPSYKLGLRVGAVFYVRHNLGVAPEAEFDYSPVNTNDATYQSVGIDAQFNRVRGLFGGRVIVPFGIGSFYARLAIGVDYLTGSLGVILPVIGRQSTPYSSTAFTLEPGVGVQFNIVRHLVLGVTSGFPVAFHDTNKPLTNLSTSAFTAVDIDFLAVLGVRFE
jgi:hypothetical protein